MAHRLLFGLGKRAYEAVGLAAAEQINKGLENQQLALIVRQSNAAVRPLIEVQEDALKDLRIISKKAQLNRARVRAEKGMRIARENALLALQKQKERIGQEIRKLEDQYAENPAVTALESELQQLRTQQPPDKAEIKRTEQLLDHQKSLEAQLSALQRDRKDIERQIREVTTELNWQII